LHFIKNYQTMNLKRCVLVFLVFMLFFTLAGCDDYSRMTSEEKSIVNWATFFIVIFAVLFISVIYRIQKTKMNKLNEMLENYIDGIKILSSGDLYSISELAKKAQYHILLSTWLNIIQTALNRTKLTPLQVEFAKAAKSANYTAVVKLVLPELKKLNTTLLVDIAKNAKEGEIVREAVSLIEEKELLQSIMIEMTENHKYYWIVKKRFEELNS